jgi:hypothetical protein
MKYEYEVLQLEQFTSPGVQYYLVARCPVLSCEKNKAFWLGNLLMNY